MVFHHDGRDECYMERSRWDLMCIYLEEIKEGNGLVFGSIQLFIIVEKEEIRESNIEHVRVVPVVLHEV